VIEKFNSSGKVIQCKEMGIQTDPPKIPNRGITSGLMGKVGFSSYGTKSTMSSGPSSNLNQSVYIPPAGNSSLRSSQVLSGPPAQSPGLKKQLFERGTQTAGDQVVKKKVELVHS